MMVSDLEENINKMRMEIRKKYFEHFNHKIYNQCFIYAQELYNLEKKHIEKTK